jgi:hypothetical protein
MCNEALYRAVYWSLRKCRCATQSLYCRVNWGMEVEVEVKTAILGNTVCKKVGRYNGMNSLSSIGDVRYSYPKRWYCPEKLHYPS